MVIFRYAMLCLALAWVAGCAHTGSYPGETIAVSAPAEAIDLNNRAVVKERLMSQYAEWEGTRYRLGGMSKNGVDCSGFVYTTFRSRLGRELPRTTERQSKVGHAVSAGQRQVGDLVFFRTGYAKRHVGIYLGDSQFLHASTSQGVTISNLNNQYWRSHYWQSRRVASQ